MPAAEALIVCSERVLQHFLPLSLSAQDSRSNKLQASVKRHSSQESSWQGCGPPRQLILALHTAPHLSAQSPLTPGAPFFCELVISGMQEKLSVGVAQFHSSLN